LANPGETWLHWANSPAPCGVKTARTSGSGDGRIAQEMTFIFLLVIVGEVDKVIGLAGELQ
jgi:hypothetical protein